MNFKFHINVYTKELTATNTAYEFRLYFRKITNTVIAINMKRICICDNSSMRLLHTWISIAGGHYYFGFTQPLGRKQSFPLSEYLETVFAPQQWPDVLRINARLAIKSKNPLRARSCRRDRVNRRVLYLRRGPFQWRV